jgi:hypothetical protein
MIIDCELYEDEYSARLEGMLEFNQEQEAHYDPVNHQNFEMKDEEAFKEAV